LLQGEPRESWREGTTDYATTHLRWSAIDYNERLGQPGMIIAGDPHQPVVSEEFWTFRRAAGGVWLLSAIQQTI
jgi:predicted lipid-binding transport protein (Tim44 family)